MLEYRAMLEVAGRPAELRLGYRPDASSYYAVVTNPDGILVDTRDHALCRVEFCLRALREHGITVPNAALAELIRARQACGRAGLA